MIILVVAAHPDDEILGCGGAMASHASRGDDVYVVFMADGVTSRGGSDKLEERLTASLKACELVGAREPINLGFPDNKMDTVPLLKIIQALESLVDKVQPSIVYTHHANDLNVDHRLTHQAVMTACRPQPDSTVSEIYSFEVLSSTGWESQNGGRPFSPTCFVDVSDVWDKKLSALKYYELEMRDYPHARSMEAVEALARYRGVSAGLHYAEGFQVEKVIK